MTITLGFLIILSGLKRRSLHIVYGVIFTILAIVDLFVSTNIPYLWRYFLEGLVGVYTGLLFFKEIVSGDGRRKFWMQLGVMCSVVFVVIELLVTLSYNHYNFFLFKLGPQTIAVFSFFCGLGLLLFRLLDIKQISIPFLREPLTLLGKYSLFVYLLQIIIINMIDLFVEDLHFDSQGKCLAFSIVLFLICLIICYLLNFSMRSSLIKRLYRIAFR